MTTSDRRHASLLQVADSFDEEIAEKDREIAGLKSHVDDLINERDELRVQLDRALLSVAAERRGT